MRSLRCPLPESPLALLDAQAGRARGARGLSCRTQVPLAVYSAASSSNAPAPARAAGTSLHSGSGWHGHWRVATALEHLIKFNLPARRAAAACLTRTRTRTRDCPGHWQLGAHLLRSSAKAG
jgi:hypothetical protein